MTELYAILDNVADKLLPPMQFANEQEAIRTVRDMVQTAQRGSSPLVTHPECFELWRICDLEESEVTETGVKVTESQQRIENVKVLCTDFGPDGLRKHSGDPYKEAAASAAQLDLEDHARNGGLK